MSSFHDFGLAEPITRALADERYVVPAPIQHRPIPIAIDNYGLVGINQLDAVTAAIVPLPIFHRLTIHSVKVTIDRVHALTRAKHRANASPLKVGSSAEANHSNTSQDQRAHTGSRSGEIDVGMRGKQVGGISQDLTGSSGCAGELRALEGTPRAPDPPQSLVVFGNRFATNQRTVRPPQHSRAVPRDTDDRSRPSGQKRWERTGSRHWSASDWPQRLSHLSSPSRTTPDDRRTARIMDVGI